MIERQYSAGFHSKPSQQETMFLMSSSLVLEHWGICWLSTAHQVKMDVGFWTAFAFSILLVGIMKTITFSWLMQPAEGSRYACATQSNMHIQMIISIRVSSVKLYTTTIWLLQNKHLIACYRQEYSFSHRGCWFQARWTAPLKWCYSTITDTVDPPDPAVEFLKIIWDSVSHQTHQGFLFIHIGCPRISSFLHNPSD